MHSIPDKYATLQVPRYTSYPTAPHFHNGIGAKEYAEWLSALDPKNPISLYLHVPFCRELCWYCGCNMKLAARDEPVTQYAETLRQEVALLAAHLPSRMKISHLHWGGGTPTALTPDDLEAVMNEVRARFDFIEGAELAIESDPRTLSDAMIERIGKIGFTRASFGVQEFDPVVQKAINRIQPPEMVRASVDGLREAGVKGINFDLIYGLPHQTIETLLKTIDICSDIKPDRVALFGYAHVPWMAKKQRLIDEAALPQAIERQQQAQFAAQAMQEVGYVPIGLDHFALPEDDLAHAFKAGNLRRNFQGYTTDTAETLLGVGSTSIGKTPFGYLQNITETGAWARSIEDGILPVGKGVSFSGEDRLRAHVIEVLMCQAKVDLTSAGEKFGAKKHWWYKDALLKLDQFEQDGLIMRDGDIIALRDEALAYSRVVASAFDQYLNLGAGRHSVAV